MTIQGHKKHADITRPTFGKYARFELGILGATCDRIHSLVQDIAKGLPSNDVSYVDADHKPSDPLTMNKLSDKISFYQMDISKRLNEFDRKILLRESDIVIVNCNHFTATRQIVICTEKKRESLERKLDRLTNVGLILLDDDISVPFPFLENSIPNFPKIPILQFNQTQQVIDWIKKEYDRNVPPVKGLVLAGGKSERMQEDKSQLDYHGMPQVYFVCGELARLNVDPLISCRKDQDTLFNDLYGKVHDSFEGLGPFGAILSAFRQDPNCAWLSVACDQPLLRSAEIELLLQKRDPGKIATCFHNPETGFPEPLITLWEPKAYPRLLSFLSLGYSCPRKVLINSDIHEIHPENTQFMKNANTQEERKELQNLISRGNY